MKNLTILFCIALFTVSCSKDSGTNPAQMGSFTYTVSGAAQKTITGTNARFGQAGGQGLAEQTFIAFTIDTDELVIRIVIDPPVPGTYSVNPMTIQDGNGKIIFIPIEERDSWADLGIGSTFTNDRRSFDTLSANGGTVTISKADATTLGGSFNMSMMELLGGDDAFNNPKITVQGTFTAIKQ